MAPAHETVIRAVGMALASTSAAFAIYMLAYGAGKTRINGMEHLAIFAQPRGPGGAVCAFRYREKLLALVVEQDPAAVSRDDRPDPA